MPRVAGIAARWTRRRHLGRGRRPSDHVDGQRRRPREPALALVGVRLKQRALEQLAHDSEREPLLQLGRSCVEHPDADI
jgi:hypothetical protein